VLRPILRLGDSILSEPARAVDDITPEIETLIDDMIETMYARPGSDWRRRKSACH
jgi:peptide deformylase